MYSELPDWSFMDAMFGGIGGFFIGWAQTVPPPFSYLFWIIGFCIGCFWTPFSLLLFILKHGWNVSTKTKVYVFIAFGWIVCFLGYNLVTIVIALL